MHSIRMLAYHEKQKYENVLINNTHPSPRKRTQAVLPRRLLLLSASPTVTITLRAESTHKNSLEGCKGQPNE